MVNELVAWVLLITLILFNQGLRRAEQSALVEMFRARIPVSAVIGGNTGGTTSSATSALNQVTSPEPESSRIRKLEKLIKKRL